ncbi:MAG: DUF805 domain-containing protein [Candidatus Endonucleobacter sp. (ex Gigantidas childressi)]|nr:DUF805 domain-containing protein [Candidatus Endonucleobacter sp. (ex Gigantidas childressi)]
MKYFLGAFIKCIDFSGRASRTEYWMFILFAGIVGITLGVIDYSSGTSILSSVFNLAIVLPAISILTRRLHDTGRTGWWQLIAFIPLIGGIILLIFAVQGSHDENSYGPNPIHA